jgi:hypothetical protein
LLYEKSDRVFSLYVMVINSEKQNLRHLDTLKEPVPIRQLDVVINTDYRQVEDLAVVPLCCAGEVNAWEELKLIIM